MRLVRGNANKDQHLVYLHRENRPATTDSHQSGPAECRGAIRAKSLEAVYRFWVDKYTWR